MPITREMIQQAVKQFRRCEIKGPIKLPMRDDIRLSVSGVVIIPGFGFIHPQCFRDIAGQEALEELLRRPRVVTEYDGCECRSCNQEEKD
jgi:hypothetical protein